VASERLTFFRSLSFNFNLASSHFSIHYYINQATGCIKMFSFSKAIACV
jgi:hypothetical protein